MSQATRLVLIRHAHTQTNGGGDSVPMSGWTDLPLTPKGRVQVQLLARRLVGTPFDLKFSSPARRALDTAKAVPNVELCVEDDLRELNCGLADGISIGEVKRTFSAAWASNLRQDDAHFRWPGGESYREFRARCIDVFQRIARTNEGRIVAIFTHAGVINQILGQFLGHSPAQWSKCRPQNTALTTVELRQGMARLVAFDDHAHLLPRDASHAAITSGMPRRA